MSSFLRRCRVPLLIALIVAAAGIGLGVAVHADRDAAPVIRPYDPLW